MAKKATNFIQIDSLLVEYDRLREEKKTIDTRMKKLSEDIKKYAEENGVKNDKGSFYLENDLLTFGKMAKKSVSLIQDKAIEFFKGRKLFDAIKLVETVDEDAVEKYINEGKISFEELESITNTKVSYSVDIKKKEIMQEIEEVVVPLVASKKPKLSVKGGRR